MIQISRALVRQLRAVFRKLVPRSAPIRPEVSFQAGKEGLFIRSHRSDILAQYHQEGELPCEEIVLPLAALSDMEGSNDALVTLEVTGPGTVQACWDDAGVPQIGNYERDDPAKLSAHPPMPQVMAPMGTDFLNALASASRAVSKECIRYATNNIQFSGSSGTIVATDGHQLLVQRGFQFPWTEAMLIPASTVFACKELSQESITIGKSENHVSIQAGPWTLHLPIDKEGRFPVVDDVIPNKERAIAYCRLDPEDRAFLARSLPRLPGAGDEYSPITLDLNGQVSVRAKADGQKQTVELVLLRSEAAGKRIRLALNRTFLAQALQLGLANLHVVDSQKPILFQDEKRQYVVVPLGASLPPCKHAIQIASTNGKTGPNSLRRTKAMNDANVESHADIPSGDPNGDGSPVTELPQPATNGAGNGSKSRTGSRARKPKATGMAALIEEAESLKNTLREICGRSHKLVIALKRHRKQARVMQTSLRALKELQHIDA